VGLVIRLMRDPVDGESRMHVHRLLTFSPGPRYSREERAALWQRHRLRGECYFIVSV
jgi:hypothetical protein